MKLAIILGALVLAVLVALRLLRPARKQHTPAARKIAKKPGAASAVIPVGAGYHRSVSITCGPDACKAVQLLAGKRFLVGEMGKLPLADCTSATCQCKFLHHDDRREDDGDQRAISGLSAERYQLSDKPERRKKSGRRKVDLD